jgi:hypothetical protein
MIQWILTLFLLLVAEAGFTFETESTSTHPGACPAIELGVEIAPASLYEIKIDQTKDNRVSISMFKM